MNLAASRAARAGGWAGGGRARGQDIERRARDARARADIVAIIGADIALLKRGPYRVGLCPFHGETTPSFTVYPPGTTRSGDGHFHCFGCGAHGDAIGYVMRSRALKFAAALDWILGDGRAAPAGGGPRGAEPSASGARRNQRRDEMERAAAANRKMAAGRIWEQSRPIVAGDPVDRYLRGRGLSPGLLGASHRAAGQPAMLGARAAAAALENPWPDCLRYHPGLPYPERYGRWDAMVARVVDVRGELLGVHRTYLGVARESGAIVGHVIKAAVAAPRLSLGPLKGGAIRLAEEETHLGLAEGIEDALSAMQLFGLPCWSAIDAGKLAAVELPFGVDTVTIFADQDPARDNLPEGVGIARARALAARLRHEGRNVTILAPRVGLKDFNDQLRRERA